MLINPPCQKQIHDPYFDNDADEYSDQDEDDDDGDEDDDDDPFQDELFPSSPTALEDDADTSFYLKRRGMGMGTGISTSTLASESTGSITTGGKSSGLKKKKRKKTVPYDAVHIEMGDRSVIDKLLAWRAGEDGSEELLVKYKVRRLGCCGCFFLWGVGLVYFVRVVSICLL